MQVLIKSAEVDTKEGLSRATKQPYRIVTQTGWIQHDGETRKVPIQLRDGQAPYPQGVYEIGDESFVFGDYGRLELGRITLISVKGRPT